MFTGNWFMKHKAHYVKRLCWFRGVLHVSTYDQEGVRRRISLGTTDIERARELIKTVELPPRKRPLSRRTWLYFVQIDCPNKFIKIGTANNVLGRICDLQVAIPYCIYLLRMVEGSQAIEGATHSKFEHLRVRGEWFRPDPYLLAHIERLREDDPLERSDEMSDEELTELVARYVPERPAPAPPQDSGR